MQFEYLIFEFTVKTPDKIWIRVLGLGDPLIP